MPAETGRDTACHGATSKEAPHAAPSDHPSLSVRALALVAGGLLLAAAAQVAQAAEARHALVIGNSKYAQVPLSNPANDAAAMAKVLTRAGFTVDLKLDADQRQMDAAIRAFGDRLKGDSVGLFYFAGHGVQVKGRNFLLPVGATVQREDEVPFKAIDAQQVLDKMDAAKNRVNVVILDACRDNPFAKASRSTAGSGGLSQMDAPSGSLLAFATAPGSVASDGKGSNGLYTQHLLTNLEKPGPAGGRGLQAHPPGRAAGFARPAGAVGKHLAGR